MFEDDYIPWLEEEISLDDEDEYVPWLDEDNSSWEE